MENITKNMATAASDISFSWLAPLDTVFIKAESCYDQRGLGDNPF